MFPLRRRGRGSIAAVYVREMHLREAFLDPVSGDPTACRALIAALGDEGANCGVATLRALPFAVELGPRLIRALD
jgi:hypothetical protein